MLINNFQDNFYFITGQTGSGKSFTILNRSLEQFSNPHNKNIIVISSANLELLRFFENSFKTKLNAEQYKRVYIYTSETTGKTEPFMSKVLNQKIEVPWVILTTHAYLHKRGHSELIYPFTLDIIWLKKTYLMTASLYVEESHLYFNSLVWQLKSSGLYQEFDEIGGGSRIFPVNRFIKKKYVNGSYKTRSTRYQYQIEAESGNPTYYPVDFDRENLHIFTIPQILHLNKDKLTETEGPIRLIRGDYFDRTYSYTINNSFDYQKILAKNFSVGFRNMDFEINTYINIFCQDLNIRIVEIPKLCYKNDFSTLIANSPYIVECRNNTLDFSTTEPDFSYISGFRYGDLSMLSSVFDKTTFVSASLTSSHLSIFERTSSNFQPRIEEIASETDRFSSRKDFGAILFTKKKITNKKLLKVIDGLGPSLYFTSTIEKSKRIESQAKTDEDLKKQYVKYERDFGDESLSKFNRTFFLDSTNVNEIGPKNLVISYWNSSLFTGVDLSNLDNLIIDHKTHIPYAFIPKPDKMNAEGLNSYIEEQINESIMQGIGRVTRGKNDRFKTVIVVYPENSKTSKESDSLFLKSINEFLQRPAGIHKFENFIKCYNVDLDDLTIKWLLHQKKNSEPNMSLNYNLLNIKDVLASYVCESKDEKSVADLVKKLRNKDLRGFLENEIVKNEEEFDNFLSGVVFFTAYINKEKTCLHVGIRLEDGCSHFFDIDSTEKIRSFKVFFHELLTVPKNVVYFSATNYDLVLLDFLLSDSKALVFNEETLLNLESRTLKRNVSLTSLKRKHLNLTNLRKMLLPKISINLNDIAISLNFPELVLEQDNKAFAELLSKKLNIIFNLHLILFSKKRRWEHSDYLDFLERIFGSTYTLQNRWDLFTKNHIQKWYNPVLNQINVGEFTLPTIGTEPSTKHFLKSAPNCAWPNSYLKERLSPLFLRENKYDSKIMINCGFLIEEEKWLAWKDGNPEKILSNIIKANVNQNQNNFRKLETENCFIHEIDIRGLSFFALEKLFTKKVVTLPSGDFIAKLLSNKFEIFSENKKIFFRFLDVLNDNFFSNPTTFFSTIDLHNYNWERQILIVQLLSFLRENNFLVYLANQKSLIVSSEKENISNILENWAQNLNFIDPFVSTALSKFTYAGGKLYKQKKDIRNSISSSVLFPEIEKKNTFEILQPAIVEKILLGAFTGNLCYETPLKEFSDFIIAKIAKNKTKYVVKEGQDLLFETEYCRFIKVKDSNISLWVRNNNGKESLVIDNIKVFNNFSKISAQEIDCAYYKDLADKQGI